jgi:pimeloyl-ACP methyl ester carboxylesterase
MPHVDRPDGARIYYEIHGRGFPLLLFAPGGVSSQISFWESSAVNPFDFADEFMVIGMDQRNAGRSPAPLAAPSWEDHCADQRAVLAEPGRPLRRREHPPHLLQDVRADDCRQRGRGDAGGG